MSLRLAAFAFLASLICPLSDAHCQVLPPPRVMPPAGGMVQPVLPPVGPPRAVMPPLGMVVPVMPPAGRPIPTLPLAASPYPPPGYRPSAYRVWQNYGVNRHGWLLPRVVQIGDEGYFTYNGAYYPYVYVFPGQHWPSPAPTGPSGP